MRGVQDCVVPIESAAYAAGGLYFRRLGGGSAIQLLGDKVLWIPELSGSLICDSAEGASARRSKIRGQDRLPDDQDAEFRVRMAGEKLFGCGGPPQTCRSSWGEQEEDARVVCRGVKRALELAEARCRQNGERRLSRGRLGRPPKIDTGDQQQRRKDNPDEKSLSHFMTGRNDPPEIRQSAAGTESLPAQWRRRSIAETDR